MHPFIDAVDDLEQLSLKRFLLVDGEVGPLLYWKEKAERGQVVRLLDS